MLPSFLSLFSSFLLLFFFSFIFVSTQNSDLESFKNPEGTDSLLLCRPQMNEPECLSIGTCCFIKVLTNSSNPKTACILTSLIASNSFDEYLRPILGEKIEEAMELFENSTKKPFKMELKCAFDKEETKNPYGMSYYIPYHKLFFSSNCVGNNKDKCLEANNNCCWQESNLFDEEGKLSYRYSCAEFESAKKEMIGERDEKVFLQVIGSEEKEITINNICDINSFYIEKYPSLGPNLLIQQRDCQCQAKSNSTQSSDAEDDSKESQEKNEGDLASSGKVGMGLLVLGLIILS